MNPRIKLLCFDLDDTLWPLQPTLNNAEARLQSWFADKAPALTERYNVEQLRAERFRLWEQRPDLHHQISRWRQISMQTLLEDCGYATDHAALLARQAMAQLLKWRHDVELFPGVAEVLEQLSKHYPLVAITNGNADVFRSPAAAWFDSAIRAEQVDVSKPHRDIFLSAIAPYDVDAAHCVHIGDHPDNDVGGAIAVGMTAVHCALEGTPHADSNCCEQRFSRWESLPDLLTAL